MGEIVKWKHVLGFVAIVALASMTRGAGAQAEEQARTRSGSGDSARYSVSSATTNLWARGDDSVRVSARPLEQPITEQQIMAYDGMVKPLSIRDYDDTCYDGYTGLYPDYGGCYLWGPHPGVDMTGGSTAIDCGTPVVAACTGPIIWVEQDSRAAEAGVCEDNRGSSYLGPSNLGWVVVLRCDVPDVEYNGVVYGGRLFAVYGHLRSIEPGLGYGVWVAKGQKLGEVGSTGHSQGPHLHFQIEKDHDKGHPYYPTTVGGIQTYTWNPMYFIQSHVGAACCGCLPASCCSAATASSNGFSAETAWSIPDSVYRAARPAMTLVDSGDIPVTETGAAPTHHDSIERDQAGNPVYSDDLRSAPDALLANPTSAALELAEARDHAVDTPLELAWAAVAPQRIPPASTSYRIAKSVIGSGGGQKTSTHFIMNGTQGQSTDLNRRRSANYVLAPGYWGRWTPLVYDFDVHLPIVAKDH